METHCDSPIGPGIFNGPRTLSIMPTFTCPAACEDCGTLSSPADRTRLPPPAILAAIDEAHSQGFANVVFTGGEATLRFKDLLRAIRRAHELGFPTRLVTNAHWATTRQRADRFLGELIAAGLDEINYSTGDEHVRFVPLQRVIHAAVAAVKRGLRLSIMVELRGERRVTRDDLLEHPAILALPEDLRRQVRVSESPWMPLDPLAVAAYPEGTRANADNVGARRGCDSVLQTYVVQADGRVAACCGLGMRLLPEMQVATVADEGFLATAVEEAENDFLKVWIHYQGPEKILAWAAEKDPSIDWENRYAHRCQACLRLYEDPRVRKVVRRHYLEMFAQVLQGAYLEDEYIPERLGDAVRANPRHAATRQSGGPGADGPRRA